MAGAAKPKILLVDDSEEVRLMFAEYLDYQGYDVVHAADGEEALRQVQSDSVDLVVLDRLLPTLDGLAVLKALRVSRRGKGLPVILRSGLTGVSDRGSALGA